MNRLSKIQVLLLVILHSLANDIGQPRFHLLYKQFDFLEAVESCESLGGEWSLPDNFEQNSVLSRVMKRQGIMTVWLGIRKFTFLSWRWVDGTLMGFPFRTSNTTQTCGAISRNGTLKSVRCMQAGIGSICELPGEQHCPSPTCFRFGDRLVMVGCQAGSWFSTRQYCRKHGGNLSILKSTSKIKFMVEQLMNLPCSEEINLFFIGLHKEDWISLADSQKIGKLADDELEEKHCAVAAFNQNGLLTLAFRRCISRVAVVCQSYMRRVTPSPTQKKTQMKPTEAGQSTTMLLATIIPLAVVAAFLLGIVMLLCRRHVQRSHQETEKENEEQIELIDKSGKKDAERSEGPCSPLAGARKKILNDNLTQLMKSIQLSGSGLLNELLSMNVITEANIKFIEENSQHDTEEINDNRKNEELIDIIIKKTNEDFDKFCEALVKTGQKNVVQNFLLTEYDYDRAKTCILEYLKDFCNVQLIPFGEDVIKRKIHNIFTDMTWLFSRIDSTDTAAEEFSNFEEIFHKIDSIPGCRVIITGKTGAGKTTFAMRIMTEFCDAWEKGQKDLVLPIVLRTVAKDTDTFTLLKNQIPSLSHLSIFSVLNILQSKNKANKWIILDGYDELGDKNFINEHFLKCSYPNTNVLITSRSNLVTTISSHLSQTEQQLIRIKGFRKENIHKYITLFYDGQKPGKQLSEFLMKEEKEKECSNAETVLSSRRKVLLRMAKIPIFLQVMCIVWRSKSDLGEKIVDLYSRFIECVFHHYNTKYGSQEGICEAEQRPCMFLLGALANSWNTPNVVQYAFSTDELRKCFSDRFDIILKLGFLVQLFPSNKKADKTWCFSHTTLQEYFIAYYLANQERSHMSIQKFAAGCMTVRILEKMKMIIAFICGINADCANIILSSVVKTMSEQNDCGRLLSFLVNMVPEFENNANINFPLPKFVEPTDKMNVNNFEILLRTQVARRHSNMQELLLTEKAIKNIRYHFDPTCLSEIAGITFHIDTETSIDWASNIIKQAKHIERLSVISETGEEKEKIRKMIANVPNEHLSSITVHMKDSMDTLVPTLNKFPSLKHLCAVDEKTGREANDELDSFREAIRKCRKLEHLDLTVTDLCTGFLLLQLKGFISLAVTILTTSNLQHFIDKLDKSYKSMERNLENFKALRLGAVGDTKMAFIGKHLALVISKFTELETLSINKLGLTKDTMDDIRKKVIDLGCKVNLSSFSVAENSLKGSGEMLGKLLTLMPALETLNISNNELSPKDILEFTKCLENHDALQELNLSKNNIFGGDITVGDICSCFSSLRNLDVSACGITQEHTEKAFSGMTTRTLSTLNVLKLNDNYLSNNGIVGFSSHLRFFSNIQVLEMASTGCTDMDSLEMLITSLPSSLTEFVIRNNTFERVTDVVNFKEKLRNLKVLSIGTYTQEDERDNIRYKLQKINPDVDVRY